jgi:hypothetical protein
MISTLTSWLRMVSIPLKVNPNIFIISLIVTLFYNTRLATNRTTLAFIKYLKSAKEAKQLQAFKKDEWISIIDFLETHVNTLSNYSEMEAWPTMFDSFVEWVKGSSEFQDLLSC